jgi:hypothetical protein
LIPRVRLAYLRKRAQRDLPKLESEVPKNFADAIFPVEATVRIVLE